MAYGIEVVLGFNYEQLSVFEGATGISMPRGDALRAAWSEQDILEGDRVVALNERLATAHRRACEKMGFTHKQTKGRHEIYGTPLGVREMVPFTLEFFFDPGELGEEVEQSIVGVSISGRYFPTFLDWRSAHGTIWNQPVHPLPREMQIARDVIMMAIPGFSEASYIIRDVHY